MEHAMATIAAAGLSSVASTGATFNTGKDTAGFSLYEAFAIQAQKDARITCIVQLVKDGMTCAEYDEAVKAAIGHAAAADKLTGFVPAEGAKGRDKYGPLQSSMAQRASEMRQVFGYLKHHEGAQARGYLETLADARAWLKEKGIDWTGADVKAQRAAAEATKQTKALADATRAAMLTTPKVEGETQGQWFERVAQNAQKAIAEAESKAADSKVQKCLESLVKNFEPVDVYSIAMSLLQWTMDNQIVSKDQMLADVGSMVLTEQAPI